MRDSADSYDPAYGRLRRAGGNKRGRFDEATYEKRNRHRPGLVAEDANDHTDGLPEGDRWSTWDQTEILVPNVRPSKPVRPPDRRKSPLSQGF